MSLTSIVTATLSFRVSRFNNDRSTIELSFIQGCDGAVGFVIVWHLNKAKTFGSSGFTVFNNFSGSYLSKLGKRLFQVFAPGLKIQSSNENIHINGDEEVMLTKLTNKRERCQQPGVRDNYPLMSSLAFWMAEGDGFAPPIIFAISSMRSV